MSLSKKQIITVVFILAMVIAVPSIVLLVKNNQESRSKADETPPTPIPGRSLTDILPNKDICPSVSLSSSFLSPGQSLNIYTKTNKEDIKSFLYVFSQKGSKKSVANGDKPSFPSPSFIMTQKPLTLPSNTISISYDYFTQQATILGKDKPNHIQLNTYTVDNQGQQSEIDPKCGVYFEVL